METLFDWKLLKRKMRTNKKRVVKAARHYFL